MNKFLVIDHSIKRIGGHNYEYALHILRAAERQGFRPILAVNRRFFERRRLPTTWQLYSPFRHTTYEAARLAAKQRQLDPAGALIGQEAGRLSLPADQRGRRGWLRALPATARRYLVGRYEAIRRNLISHFAEDLTRVFNALQLNKGDQVFVPTLSEDDLAGLLSFFRGASSQAHRATWHLQFHFSVYDGRAPRYEKQDARLATLVQLFHEANTALPPGSVHFYTTTEILADQFNRLGAACFQTLPYPVNPALLEKARRSARTTGPLRITSAGGVRAEKGTQELYRSVAPLWSDYFETGRLQLVVQAKRLGKLPAELRKHARYDREPALLSAAADSPPKVAVIRWPLSTEKYLDLIRNSDIGLLLYDADQYYARCSGVMVEMLKAGVPVIVPAGCWMADQIAESIFSHRERLCRTAAISAHLTPAEADWEAGPAQRYYLWRRDARLLVGGSDAALCTRLAIPDGATHLCVRFRWSAMNPQASYVELAAETKIAARPQVAMREIVGMRPDGAAVPVLMALGPGVRTLQLTWRNAFDDQTLSLEDVEFLFLSAAKSSGALGAVGLVAAGVDQAPRLLRDIADHYEYYRSTAEAFAPAWGEWHSPEKVVHLLTHARVMERQRAA
jgi:hypothetical protein